MAAYLNARTGPELGRRFPLDSMRPMHIGRSSSCEIVLTDPVCSRFHAVIYFDDHQWQVRDTRSRNGMLVNGQKTNHAALQDQAVVQVGGTELLFLERSKEDQAEYALSQTLQLDRPMAELSGVLSLSPEDPLRQAAQAGHLLDLYQLSLNLLRTGDPDQVTDMAIELLRDRTKADVIGLLWDSGTGKLTPERIAPATAAKSVKLSHSLTQRVTQDDEAIWIKDRSKNRPGYSSGIADSQPSQDWSDAICVPLVSDRSHTGVLHLYRERNHFSNSDFELAVAAGRLLGAALARVRRQHSLEAEQQRLAQRNADLDEMVGQSDVIVTLKEKINKIAKVRGAVLIRGESGSGKELVARALHRASPRKPRPMLSVNCAAIPRDLMESQLFGHRKGAFTGAAKDHIGWFQQAHTGTLFLDEIGELTLEGQAKLLRILEGHPFLPVGGTEEILADVRVIAATNRNLLAQVQAKQFREDLYYRLSVFELVLPPLREREGDIKILINYFLSHFRLLHGRPNLELSKDAVQRLLIYRWPGNVRQLRNVIDSAVVMTEGPEIESADLGLRDEEPSALETLRIDHWEKRLIQKAMQRSNGSIPEAAKLLGISRATAYRKLSDFESK